MEAMRFLVFGLQSSGKSTFAAALWHLLDSREVKTALTKGQHTGEYHYLEKIAQLWSEGWRLERTTIQNVEDVRINLKSPAGGEEIALEFTDLAGESFEHAFANRFCEPSLVDAVKSADGLILFVSAQRVIDDVTILDAFGGLEDEAEDSAEADDENVAPNAEGATDEVPPETPWDPAKAPHQVQLVDLLQAFQHPPFDKPKFLISVIISAWDLADGNVPEKWFETRFPLLHQYLSGKFGSAGFKVYGVSAQGGKLTKKGEGAGEDRDRLLSIVPASKRILIEGPDVAAHDITQPIYWLSTTEPKD